MICTYSNPSHPLNEVYVGPEIPNNINREKIPFSANQAPSYIPDSLITRHYLQETSQNHFLRKEKKDHRVEDFVQKVQVNEELLRSLSSDIENHVEMRIHNFLIQMIIVFKTQLIFGNCGHAEIQVGEVRNSRISEGDYAAAHSSTLPALRLAKDHVSNTSVSFAKDTSFYRAWNTTIYLPTIVNTIDVKIDTSTRHSINAKNLRSKATDILNIVSSGNKTPKDGLRSFLDDLIEVVEASINTERNKMCLMILNIYLRIAQTYHENIDNGKPLLQKIFFRPWTEEIDPSFYSRIQTDIYHQFRSEMQQLMPRMAAPTSLPVNFDAIDIQQRIIRHLSPFIEIKLEGASKTEDVSEKYLKLCTLSADIEHVTLSYFLYLHRSSMNERENDLKSLSLIKQEKTSLKLSLSPEARALHQEALKVINTNAMKIDYILLSILHHFIHPLAQQAQPQPTTSQLSLLKEDHANLIDEMIIFANIPLTKSMHNYILIGLKCPRIKKIAQSFFCELYHLQDDSLKKKKIAEILQIKTEASLPSNLSKNSIEFYKEVRNSIRSSTEKQELNPANMGRILCGILLKGSGRIYF